jgi:hypothetical protein
MSWFSQLQGIPSCSILGKDDPGIEQFNIHHIHSSYAIKEFRPLPKLARRLVIKQFIDWCVSTFAAVYAESFRILKLT